MVLLGIAIFAILMASFFLRGIIEGRREASAGAKVPTANENLLANPPAALKSNLYKAPEGAAPTMDAPVNTPTNGAAPTNNAAPVNGATATTSQAPQAPIPTVGDAKR